MSYQRLAQAESVDILNNIFKLTIKKIALLNCLMNNVRYDVRIGDILKHRKFNYYIKVIEIGSIGEVHIIKYIKTNAEGVPWIKQGTPTSDSELKLLMETYKPWA